MTHSRVGAEKLKDESEDPVESESKEGLKE